MDIKLLLLLKFLCTFCLITFSTLTLAQQTGQPIGLMLSTSGSVTAQDLAGNVRVLQRRSPVYEGDTLITADRSRAQVRFNDRGLVALQPDTSFFIQEHKYEGQEDGSESAIYSLLRGGLQAITGLIGHSNKDRYQVSTPLATIGLRGTHWTATYCTATCDGNPPGLYGGVADGGIDVCNGGGCAAIGANTYFYTPDANTRPRTLLAPPSVVFAATPEDEEGEGEEQVAEEDGNDEGRQTPSDVEEFAARNAQSTAVAAAAARAVVVPVVIEAREPVAENTEDLIEREVAVPPIPPTPAGYVLNPQSTPATAGVAAIATTATLNGQFALAGTTEGVPDATIGLIDLASANATNVLTDFADEEGSFSVLEGTLEEYSQTSNFIATNNVLNESGQLSSSSDFAISIGRWNLANSALQVEGVDYMTTADAHFGFSNNQTNIDSFLSSNPFNLSKPLLTYTLVKATSPTDEMGNLGLLSSVSLELDLFEQLISDFSIDLTIGSRHFFASLANPAPLEMSSFLELVGDCSGGDCGTATALLGEATVAFLGAGAEGALGDFGLYADRGTDPDLEQIFSDITANGVFVLARNFIGENLDRYDGEPPLVLADPLSGFAFAGNIEMQGMLRPFDRAYVADDYVLQLFKLLSDVPAVFEYLYGPYYEDAQIYGIPGYEIYGYSESFGINSTNGGFLADLGSYNFGQDTVTWGRWIAPSGFDFEVNSDSLATGTAAHFIWASYVSDAESLGDPTPSLAHYAFVGGTKPTNENGVTGSVTDISLDLDFYQQAIVGFDMEISIADRIYTAGLAPTNSTFYLDYGLSADGVAQLSGLCTGGDCGSGTALHGRTSFVLAGDSASTNLFGEIAGIVGSYALETSLLEQDFGDLYDLIHFDYYYDAVGPGELVFDGPYVSASGTYLLVGLDSVNPLYLNPAAPPAVVNDPNGLVALATSSYGYDYSDYYYDELFADTLGSFNGSTIHLVDLNGAGNQVVGFESIAQDSGGAYYSLAEIYEGVLAEAGGTSSFLADNGLSGSPDFGVNWGRWYATSSYLEGDVDLTDPQNPVVSNTTEYYLNPIQHFVYTDAENGIFPSFPNPAIATYRYAGGPSPTDELGRTGTMDATMELDLFAQQLTHFELSVDIADRHYFAVSAPDYYYYYYSNPYGIYPEIDYSVDFADLLTESISLQGVCVGGDCTYYDPYYFQDTLNLQLQGYASLAPFGPAGEGFAGAFTLEFDGNYYCECYSPNTDISVIGAFTLAQAGTQTHPGWQVNPVGVAATAPSVAVVVGTRDNGSFNPDAPEPINEPFAGVVAPSMGDAFTTLTVGGVEHVVDSGMGADMLDCDICSIEIQNAVLIASGTVSNTYPYLSNLSKVYWGTWANLDLPDNEFAFGSQGNPLSTLPILNYLYADNLTSASALQNMEPLTPYYGNSTVYYQYAGGPAPVNEAGVRGYLDQVYLYIDFEAQQLSNFYANIEFDDGRDISLYQDYSATYGYGVDLAPTMQLDLYGYCYYCGIAGSGYTTLDLIGEAELAVVGDYAEQIIGGLAAWSDSSGSYDLGDYSVQAGFVLNQEIDPYWVNAAAFGARVTKPTMAAFAPVFSDGQTIQSAPYLVVDPGTGDFELDIVDYYVPYNYYYNYLNADIPVMPIFAGYNSPTDQFSVNAGRVYDWGFSVGGYSESNYYYDFAPDEDGWFTAYWGQWYDAAYVHNISGIAGEPQTYLPFVVSEDVTLSLPTHPFTGGSGSIAQYHYLGGPSSYNSYYGASIQEILMSFDFMNQSVVDFYLKAYGGNSGRYWELNMDSAIARSSTTQELSLSGLCLLCSSSGADEMATGSAAFGFLGDMAEGAAGSYSVASATGGVIAGVYVLEQNDHWVSSPDTLAAPSGGVVAFAAMEASPVNGTSFGFYTDSGNSADLTNVVSFDHDHPNSLAAFSATGNSNCGNCSWQVTNGEIYSYDNTVDDYLDYLPEAYWGRWQTQDDLVVDGSAVALTEYQHWAYSPDPSQYSDPVWNGSEIYQYSYAEGSYPTDNFGNQGYINSINMAVNLGNQSVDSFSLSTYVGSYSYNASTAGPQALDAAAPFANLALSGTTSGAGNYAITGNSSVFLIGSEADAAIGSFDLNAAAIGTSVNGAFILEHSGTLLP